MIWVAFLSILLALGLFMIFTTTPARAEQRRLFSGSLGTASSTAVSPYPLSPGKEGAQGPWSVAVNSSTGPSVHDVYVTDGANNRIEKFGPFGEFLLMFGKAVNETEHDRIGLEPGETTQQKEAKENVCVAESLDICQAGTADSTPGAFESSEGVMFVAVNNSSGGEGDVYVADFVEHGGAGNTVSKFDPYGHLIASWGTGGRLDGSNVPFGEIDGIAVDPSGNLWVSTVDAAFEFKQNSAPMTEWSHPQAGPFGIAVNSEDNLYLATDFNLLKFSSAGADIGQITESGVRPDALTVDPSTNDLYVAPAEASFRVLRYEPSCQIRPLGAGCAPAESFTSSHPAFGHGLAIDPSSSGNTLYAAELSQGEVAGFSFETVPDVSTAKASGFTPTSATLNGTVNPAAVPVTECFFEWGESQAYGQKTPCEHPNSAEVGSGSSPVEVHADITGLQHGKTYHFRLVAGNDNDVNASLELDEPSQGQDVSFGPPLIDSASVSSVTSTSATLEAQVEPNNVDTHLKIEYGTDTSYGQATPETDIGSAATSQSVSPHIQSLASDTVYHYRVIAHSALGTVAGEDHMFTTQRAGGPAGESVLPDGRVWELVSPANKHGADILPIRSGESRFAIQAAAGGGLVTYLATSPTEAEPDGNSNYTQTLSNRGSDGWGSLDIAIPHNEATGLTDTGEEYRVFSDDLSLGLLQPLGAFNPTLSAEASEQTVYLRSDFPGGDPGDLCRTSCSRPLVTGAPGFENVPPGTEFGIEFQTGNKCPPEPVCGPQFLGATPDLNHVILLSRVPLSATPENDGGLFEWSGGQLQLVSILPSGEAAALNTGLSLGGRIETSGTEVETAILPRHAISADGARVVWSEGDAFPGNGHLYLRDTTSDASGKTIQLDAGKGFIPVGAPSASFQDASSDDSKVFFTDEQKLTPGSGASGGKPDLYQCEVAEVEDELECKLTDLTPENSGEPAAVQGTVIGASDDGSYVYFVADGVLTGTEENERGEKAQGDQPNLYVSHDGTTKLVGVLSAEDSPDWAGTAADEPLPELTAHVSPNGRWLAFMSERSLTGYDNRDANSGHPDEEVYLYAAAADGGEGHLDCVSCDPTGARPLGVEYENLERGLAGGDGGWQQNQWLAANIPGWTSPRYQSRYLSDSGRLFFNSSDALVPQDTNHTEDVYEYEPPKGEETAASDTCTTESPTYSPGSDGCVGLISSGTSPEESAFLDASETGDDVFFLTTAELSPQDLDSSLDVYDAHACSAASPCPPPPPALPPVCVGDACQSSGSTPEDPTPGSLTFHGPGNISSLAASLAVKPMTAAQIKAKKLTKALKVCRAKTNKHKRAVCEELARKRYGAAHKAKKSSRAKNASNRRRAK